MLPTYGAANCVIRFITEAMAPVRYVQEPGLRTLRQDALNEVLVFVGLHLRDDGRLGTGPRAETLSHAAQHANNLRAELRRRGTHPDVLRYCSTEILGRNTFHTQLEATKSVFDKLRDRTGDGALVDAALSLGRAGVPVLVLAAAEGDDDGAIHGDDVNRAFRAGFVVVVARSSSRCPVVVGEVPERGRHGGAGSRTCEDAA